MSEEPRRSGRATKGLHKGSPSPAPPQKPTVQSKATSKSKSSKKQAPATAKQESEEGGDEDGEIRCICGDTNPNDKRTFIGCDQCDVWQHNVCMGLDDDGDKQPDNYFCEQCAPNDHRETVYALEDGIPIWEERNRIWKNEKKMSSKRKSKGGEAGWLKKDVPPREPEEADQDQKENVVSEPAMPSKESSQEVKGAKRKRDHNVDEAETQKQPDGSALDEAHRLSPRSDKRWKSAAHAGVPVEDDPETAIVSIPSLPADRKKVAEALSKAIAEDVSQRIKDGYQVPDGFDAKSLAEHHAVRIEYALHMNHGQPKDSAYAQQFRALIANLKRNKILIERMLSSTLTADELSTMPSSDMASEELMKERAAMKAENDRQAVRITEENGPRYRRTHKGDEIIEDETKALNNDSMTAAQPVRDRHYSVTEGTEGDMGASPPRHDGPQSPRQLDRGLSMDNRPAGADRRTSSQQFDVDSIWSKTGAGSPTQSQPRLLQIPPRRRSSMQQGQDSGVNAVQHDADIDRMLANNDDDDEAYSPTDAYEDGIVWRGKLEQTDNAPMINARFVAGRDLGQSLSWRDLLPHKLTIDGRLQIQKAEDYLCGLQWSSSSDVSVLTLTPYDDRESFDRVFDYFKSRGRYAVVNRDKPSLCKDLYIVPVDKGDGLPEHVSMLELCKIKTPIEERLLLATMVVSRAPVGSASKDPTQSTPGPANGNGNLPQHLRQSMAGPAASPINAQGPTFSPSTNQQNQQPVAGYGAPVRSSSNGHGNNNDSPLPQNPYALDAAPANAHHSPPPPYSSYRGGAEASQSLPQPGSITSAMMPQAYSILGDLMYTPSAQAVLAQDPRIASDKVEHLKRILLEDPAARTDMQVFRDMLMKG